MLRVDIDSLSQGKAAPVVWSRFYARYVGDVHVTAYTGSDEVLLFLIFRGMNTRGYLTERGN